MGLWRSLGELLLLLVFVLKALFVLIRNSDAPSFEMAPLVGDHNKPGGIWKGEEWEGEMQGGGLLHQWLLGGWGVMIGEMWDLERLCDKAEELGRYTCFVSSVPLKVSLILEIVSLFGDDANDNSGTQRCGESAECCCDLLVGCSILVDHCH